MADEAVVKIVVDDKGVKPPTGQPTQSILSPQHQDELVRALKQGAASMWAPPGQPIQATMKGLSSGQADYLRMEAEAARRGMSVADYKRAEVSGRLPPLVPPQAPAAVASPPPQPTTSAAANPAFASVPGRRRARDSDREERLRAAIASTFQDDEAAQFAQMMAGQTPLGGSHTGRQTPAGGASRTAPPPPTTSAVGGRNILGSAFAQAPSVPPPNIPPPPPVQTAAPPPPPPGGTTAGATGAAGGANALASGANAAGSSLVTFAKVAGAAGIAMDAVVVAFVALTNAIDKAVDRYGELSPEIAQAKAQAEVNKLIGDMRRAQEYGNELADYVKAKAEMEERWEEIKMQIMSKFIPIATGMLNALNKLLGIAADTDNPEMKDPAYYLTRNLIEVPEL